MRATCPALDLENDVRETESFTACLDHCSETLYRAGHSHSSRNGCVGRGLRSRASEKRLPFDYPVLDPGARFGPHSLDSSTPMRIDRCYCYQQSFSTLKSVADECDAPSIEALQEEVTFGEDCELCHPYVRRMLASGQTVFYEVISADSASDGNEREASTPPHS